MVYTKISPQFCLLQEKYYLCTVIVGSDTLFYSRIRCGVEQLVARWAHNPEVVGSSPTPATRLRHVVIGVLFLFQQSLGGINSKIETLAAIGTQAEALFTKRFWRTT